MPTFVEAHEASKMIYKVRSLKLGTTAGSFLDEIITLSKEVFKGFESDIDAEIWKVSTPSQESAENNDTVKQPAGS